MNDTLYPRRRGHRYGTFLALLACALFLAAPAQADPPGRIGRIAWLSGSVNLQNTGTGDTQNALLNQPLTSGDVLSTEAGSRVEIQIGSKTIRLDSSSVLELDRIGDEQVRVYLNDGRAIVKLPTPEATGDFEMATLNGQFNARSSGIYRFGADANGSIAAAYSGRLHFAGERLALDIGAGENAQFWNDGQTRFRLLPLVNDEFSQWSSLRDRRPAENAYARYVSPEMTGAADLDAYGDWSDTPDYGAVWYPRAVAADWAPYRTGNWVWVAPWGWTWVGDEPWGFAPFHYGRWVQHRGRWGWVPGTRIGRPVYSPAMVAWIGTPGLGVAMAVGHRPTVGWFPLAPHEVYVPSYRSSTNYLRQVNITHIPHLANAAAIVGDPQAFVSRTHYAHRESPQAVTFVPAEVVTQRRSVAAAALPAADRRALREQPLQAAAPLASPAAAARIRQEPGLSPQGFGQRENDRQEHFVPVPGASSANHSATLPVPAAPTPAVAAPRSGQVAPEFARPAPQPRPETFAPHAAIAVPSAAEHREVAPPRNEQVRPEIVRPTSPPRAEALEPRVQERPVRREEAAPHQSQREIRVEPAAPQSYQVPATRAATPPAIIREPRHEAPREASREPPGRVEAKSQPAAQRPAPNENKERRHRDEAEKR